MLIGMIGSPHNPSVEHLLLVVLLILLLVVIYSALG